MDSFSPYTQRSGRVSFFRAREFRRWFVPPAQHSCVNPKMQGTNLRRHHCPPPATLGVGLRIQALLRNATLDGRSASASAIRETFSDGGVQFPVGRGLCKMKNVNCIHAEVRGEAGKPALDEKKTTTSTKIRPRPAQTPKCIRPARSTPSYSGTVDCCPNVSSTRLAPIPTARSQAKQGFTLLPPPRLANSRRAPPSSPSRVADLSIETATPMRARRGEQTAFFPSLDSKLGGRECILSRYQTYVV